MEEIEVPLESAHEELHKGAHEGGWLKWAALTAAVLAALAAVAALMSGHFANEAMIEQIRASNKWSHYQAKSIKGSFAEARLAAHGASAEGAEELKAKVARYEEEKKEIQAEAEDLERESRFHLALHGRASQGVTFFQVAIAVAAISVLARKRRYFAAACAFGAVGLVFICLGARLYFAVGHGG